MSSAICLPPSGGWSGTRREVAAEGRRRKGGLEMILILLWLLGVPLGLIIILWLLGVGR
jgi:hypothetical protein